MQVPGIMSPCRETYVLVLNPETLHFFSVHGLLLKRQLNCTDMSLIWRSRVLSKLLRVKQTRASTPVAALAGCPERLLALLEAVLQVLAG